VISALQFLSKSSYVGIIGIASILTLSFLLSNNKRKINIQSVASAFAIQLILTFLILKTNIGQNLFDSIAHGFETIYMFADQGSHFVLGKLADSNGPLGIVFAVKVVPTIIFFGALTSLLFHLGIIQIFVSGLSILIRPILGTSGAETLSVTANIMLGQTEAPLLIKNYLPKATESEMLTIMVSGMAHLSGAILAVYGSIGVPLKHLVISSIIAVPSSILISKILIPETEIPQTAGGKGAINLEKESKNVLDAISRGTSDGLKLAANVVAMLVAFISLIALFDHIMLSTVKISLKDLFAKMFYIVTAVVGIPEADRSNSAALIGQRLVINEFIAYSDFVKMELAEKSKIIMTYVLAGFGNFASIGIQIGGIGAICPEKREMLARLGIKAMLGGLLANLLNAAIVGLFL
jgi:concentrative nucleoside transporter, CNT family